LGETHGLAEREREREREKAEDTGLVRFPTSIVATGN